MDKGKITVSDLKAELGIAYQHILDIQVENKANEHGKLFLLLEVPEEIQLANIISLEGTQVTITLPDGNILFQGTCKGTAFDEQAGYKTLGLEVYSHTIVMDENRRTETYQSPSKSLENLVGGRAQSYGATYRLRTNVNIAEVVYQKDETDWNFIKRLANQYSQHIYAETRCALPGFVIGTENMRRHADSVLSRKLTAGKDIQELRQVMGNVDSSAASYQVAMEEYLCDDLTVIPGDCVGQNTVKENHVINNKGILENRVIVARTEETKPVYELIVSKQLVSSVLTGKVIGVTGNTLQVQFDTDAGDMAGNCVDVPYESPISNSFYCMPDEGDQVFVYYENNGKIVCLGSKRSNTNHPDFQNYQEKSLTAHDKMLRFTQSSVKLTTTRAKHDAEDDTEISIILDDVEGITITSGKDITIETTDGSDIFLDAHEPEQVPEELYAALTEGQKKFLDSATAGNQQYVREGGMNFWEGTAAVREQYWDQELARLKQNAVDTFTFPNLRQLLSGSNEQNEKEEEEQEEVEQEQYTRGVLTIYGLNAVTMQVQRSFIVLDADVYINADTFDWLGYTKGEHEPAIEEYQDWFGAALDGLQLVLDIAGFLPAPIGVVCDLANSVISLARGDVCGAAMSLLGAVPGLGDAAKATYKAVKAAKGVNTARKFLKGYLATRKILKTTNLIYGGIMFLDQFPAMWISYCKIIEGDGKFDVNSASDWQALISILRTGVGITKTGKDAVEAITKGKGKQNSSGGDDGPTNPGGNDSPTPSNHNDGPETTRQSSDTTSDPINVITGSLLAEYVDISIEDVLGSFDLKRCYESAFDNRGGLLGDKWRYEIESSVCVQGAYATVQLPDLHLEKFVKEQGNWENIRTGDNSYVLSETAEGFLFRKKGENAFYQYNQKGQLTVIEDIHGNRTTLQYDESGMLERITAASGQWIEFRYQNGKVCELEDSIGRKVCYTYQDSYLHTASLPNGGTMRYDYTREGYISCAYDLNGNWYTRNFYDRKGRVIRQELAGGEEYVAFYDDANWQNTFLTTSTGDSIIYQYGREKLARKIIYPDQTTVEKRYDAGKNIIYEKDRMGNEIFRTFHENGMLLEETMPDGLKRSYEYDEQDRLLRMYDNAGRETCYEYDSCGNMTASHIRMDKETMCTTTYTHDSKGRILSMTDARGNTESYVYELPISGATSYKTMAGNVIRYTYDEAGRVQELEDELGRKSYGYNNLGQRTIIRDEEGNTTRFYYDSMANLIKKIRPNAYNAQTDDGDGIMYEYDVWEQLTRVIYPDGGVYTYENDFYGKRLTESGPEDFEDGETRLRRYEYDSDHNRIRSIYPDGGVLREFLDANGNLIKRILPEAYDAEKDDGAGYTYEYDSCNRLLQITNPLGVTEHRYVYDLAGNLIKDIDAKGYQSAGTDEERIGTLYRYDLTGNVTEIRRPLEVTGEGVRYRLMTYRYDTAGNCIEEKRYLDYQSADSAKGRVNCIHYGYDSASRLVHIHDSLGACMEYAYNCRNQRTMEKRKIAGDIWQERHYFYSPSGRIERIMDSADEKGCGRKYTPTWFSYDQNGNLTCIKTASGYEIRREYDVCDRMISETHCDKSGSIDNTVSYTYDREGRLTGIRHQDGYCISWCYDCMGRLKESSDSRGAVEHLVYDRNGRLTERRNGAGGSCRYAYDGLGRTISVMTPDGEEVRTIRYNAFGEMEEEGDPTGRIRYEYDHAGRRILAQTEAGSGQEYRYDAAGNIIALKDGNGGCTEYETDLWGRITGTRKADGSYEAYTYDHAGNIIMATDGNGNTVEYRYNSLNLLAGRRDAAGFEETFHYDLEGRLCEHTDRDGRREIYRYNLYGSPVLHEETQSGLTESWEYDPLGRLKSATGGGMRYEYAYYPGGLLKEKRASGRVLAAYEYDHAGRKTAQTDLTGKRTEYRYNPKGMLAQVEENGNTLAAYAYNPDGTLHSLRIGSSIETAYSYDSDKNLTGLKTMLDGSTMLADNRYRYDQNGNRVSKEAADGLTRYSYDACNRLVEVQYPDIMGRQHFERLTYDGAGNRITRLTESVTEQYRYDNCNRLEELRKTDNRTGQEEERNTYRYDRQGNLLSDGSLSYVYDGFCRVSEVETAEGGTQKNRYDAEGLRHEMEENGRLVQFLYADREVIAETQSDGNVIRYIRGLGLISSDSEKAKTYYHYVSDEQGSITHVTEGEGKTADESQSEHKILNRYTYDAFGNTTDCEETVANRFRYLGEQHDPITQQYYLRARYYNPVIGRFTQEDTYYGDGLNLYQYCAGNPVRYCDPSGHGSVEQNPYKRYTDVGADADTAALAGQAYPDASSKQSLYNKYRNMGYSAENALMLANHEIIHGTASTEGYAKNVPKTGTDRTQTSPRDNYSTDWRSQNRANQQRGDGGSNTLPDPYAQLRERGIPQTLTDAEINAANQAGLRMMAGESGSTSKYYNPDGSPIWPPNRGFDGNPTKVILEPGTLIDRYGYDGGTFVSPKGTSYTERALPIGTDQKPYTVFEVVKPIEVQAGKIAPWFGEKGGGIQYEFSQKISDLLEQGILRKVQK